LAGLNVSHRLLAREVVRDVGFTVELDAELDPVARRLSLERLALGRAGVELIADEAWRFLIDGLQALQEAGWVVFGETQLAHNRVVREALQPRLRLGPSTDWFELQIDFDAGKQQLPAAEVIASWLAGERFVRLADARVAALPARWLERHGSALAELVELQRSDSRGLGPHALPLAAALLEEVAADEDL
ncbi:MAG: hypothetical protein KC457_36980, partial [Myxococcales bacterium]|nr:hypothetical protein [Myxococcales bacterium]